MIASEKSLQNLSDYSNFLFKKRFEVNKKQFFPSEKIRKSDNCIYEFADSFFGVDFKSNALYWYLRCRDIMYMLFRKNSAFYLTINLT